MHLCGTDGATLTREFVARSEILAKSARAEFEAARYEKVGGGTAHRDAMHLTVH